MNEYHKLLPLKEATFDTVTLDVEQFFAARQIEWPFADRPEITIERNRDIVQMMVREMAHMPAQRLPEIRYPASWWDAVKERFFPAWAYKRWPARYVSLPERKHFIHVQKEAYLGDPVGHWMDH